MCRHRLIGVLLCFLYPDYTGFFTFFNRFYVTEVTVISIPLNFLYFQNIVYSLQTVFYNYILLPGFFDM